jgi:hypothetical protein
MVHNTNSLDQISSLTSMENPGTDQGAGQMSSGDRELVRKTYPGITAYKESIHDYGVHAGRQTWALSAPGFGTVAANVLTEEEAWEGLADLIRKRSGSHMENASMDPKEMTRLMEAAGCKAEDKEDEKMAKMTAYARKMEDDKKSVEAARKMQDPPSVAQMPSNGDGQAALVQRIEALETKNAMLLKELEASRAVSSETQQVMERFRKMEADQNHAAAVDFAGRAIAMGRVSGTHRGDEAKTVEWLAGKYEKDAAGAEEFLSPEGTFKPSEAQVMQRLTVKGAGIGAPQPVIPVDGVSPLHSSQRELDGHVQIAMERLRTDGTKRTPQQIFDAAERQVIKDKPDLFKRALGQGV